ncbi:MAG TPA: glycosyltransferase [Candidatus Acidoferrales bacterium]|nr:glycosyltransferase [Candidatus Acidoferrales bacterium]
MGRPRVLHILPVLGVAGAERMAADLVVALAGAYDVGAVGLYPTMHSVTEQAMSQAGIPLWRLNKRPGLDVRMFHRIHRVFREFRPDIVHSHLHVLRYLLPASILRGIPVLVHTVHNLAEREADAAGRIVQRLAFRYRVIPVAVSGSVAASMRRVYGIEDAVTIPNGIPLGRFRADWAARVRWRGELRLDERDFLFVATGRLCVQKNPLLMLRAFAALADSRAHLVLAGDGPLRQRVEEEVRSSGLRDKVHLLGYRTDIRECLAASDVFLLSSDWEGHPLGAMEAMACGLPVIATAVGGVPEVVESGLHGLLVPPGDAVALTGAMRFLLERPQERAAMAQASRRRAAADFSLERMVRAYDELYRTRLAAVGGVNRQVSGLAGTYMMLSL